jgi:RNA polymerase sigma factor (sigma-70 family)
VDSTADEVGGCAEFWARWIDERAFFYRMCIRWLGGNRHDAEDVLSKGALQALEYLQSHATKVQRFRPWMLRILQNLCIDALRGHSRTAGLRQCAPAVAAWLAGDQRAPQGPDQAMIRHEMATSLAEAAAALPPRLYEVFTMRFIDEMPYEEISLTLDISLDNARKRIQQAREAMRDELDRLAGAPVNARRGPPAGAT